MVLIVCHSLVDREIVNENSDNPSNVCDAASKYGVSLDTKEDGVLPQHSYKTTNFYGCA